MDDLYQLFTSYSQKKNSSHFKTTISHHLATDTKSNPLSGVLLLVTKAELLSLNS